MEVYFFFSEEYFTLGIVRFLDSCCSVSLISDGELTGEKLTLKLDLLELFCCLFPFASRYISQLGFCESFVCR